MEKCSRSNSPAAYSTSTTAARRGTSSPIGPGSSCPSDCATGLTGSDQWDLVLTDISQIDSVLARFRSAITGGPRVVAAKCETHLSPACKRERSTADPAAVEGHHPPFETARLSNPDPLTNLQQIPSPGSGSPRSP